MNWCARTARGLCVLSAAFVFLSCSSESGVLVDTVVHRWIVEQPQQTAQVDIVSRQPVFEWTFGSQADLQPWTSAEIDKAYRIEEGALFIRSNSADPHLVRDAEIDADRVREVEVVHSGLTSGAAVQLFWAREGEQFSEERMVLVRDPLPGDTLLSVYRFELFRHPQWSGTIRKFRIDPTTVSDRRASLYAIRGLEKRIDPDRLAAAVASPAVVELSGDAREALLAPPGLERTEELSVPRAEAVGLRLGYGRQDLNPQPLTFSVSVDVGGARQVLWQGTAEAGDRSWRDLDVDLSPFAGRDLSIVLETSLVDAPPGDFDLESGFPVWSSPRVVARQANPGRPPNVILVVVDTLRADRLSMYGYERQTTPKLDLWAQQNGVVFEQVVAPAPWTLPSHVSLFTGLNTLSHGVNYTFAAPDSLEMMAERLRAQGYTTAAFTGGAYLTPAYGLGQGFERLVYESSEDDGGRPSASKDLDSNLERVEQWLQDVPEPFFLLLHTYEVHSPYRAWQPQYEEYRFEGAYQQDNEAGRPRGPMIHTQPITPTAQEGYLFRSRFVEPNPSGAPGLVPLRPGRREILDALYDSGVRRVDERIGGWLEGLTASGLTDRSVVVLTSDHGEGLGEEDSVGEVSAGHANLYDHNLLVPLVISWPDDRGAGSRVARQVRLVDVAPTIGQAVGLAPDEEIDGRDLTPLLEDSAASFPRTAFSYAGSSNFGLSVRTSRGQKMIYNHAAWQPLQGQIGLYDLATDPREMENLQSAEDWADTGRELERVLKTNYLQAGGRLVLRARNATDLPLQAVVRGKLAHAFTTKSFELACDGCVRWTRGDLVIELDAGEEVRLHLEGLARGELRTQLRLGPAGGARAVRREILQVREVVEEPLFWTLQGRSFVEAPVPRSFFDEQLPPLATGLALVWQPSVHGGLGAGSGAAAQVDQALREQLESLGYVQ